MVAPHQDDEAFGCGGTLHLLARAGAHVHVVIVARGDGGVDGGARVEEREAESRQGCEVLGLSQPVFLRVPSQALREDPAAAGRALAAAAGHDAWQLVFVPSPLERHDTHRAVLLAALCAGLDAAPGAWWAYGVWDAIPSVDDVAEVDITPARTAKATAMSGYRSQLAERPLAAAMAARDMAQAIFSRVTGPERRKAVERLLALEDLFAGGPMPADAAAVHARVAGWLGARSSAWAAALWGRAPD
ncbi:MAG: PIG-L deacetylase family protein [Planctomycetota bacterium]